MNAQTNFVKVLLTIVLATVLLPTTGCLKKRGRNRSEAITQALEEQKTKTDNLRNALRYLQQLSPVNRKQAAKEVQLELNTWLASADRSNVNYSPSELLQQLPAELLPAVGSSNPVNLQFGYWDIDYLYGRRLTNKLADWIVGFPVRDNLMNPILEQYAERLEEAERLKLIEAYKLFDWTIRNIALDPDTASVEQKTLDPRGPVTDDGPGYGYLPWEVLLFSSGDYIERGRVFGALADQRGIDTAWISVGSETNSAGHLWAMAVVVGDEILVFEPKLGLPILDPDKVQLATLTEIRSNSRILRRLDLPGQFDYAYSITDLGSLQFLIDAEPVAASARMKMVEGALLSDERMVLFEDLTALADKLKQRAADIDVALWHTPLLAQIQAASVRERMDMPSPFSMSYMAQHGVWLLENPASAARFKHILGEFENSLDAQGALSLYMDSRVDDESIQQLTYDPMVQKALGISKMPGEPSEQYNMRVAQAQYIFGLSKVDAAFLLAQLHFDRGNYSETSSWLQKHVLDDPRAQKWWPNGHLLLARTYQEQGEIAKAEQELTYQPSPIEAGNRLRLRYLRRETE